MYECSNQSAVVNSLKGMAIDKEKWAATFNGITLGSKFYYPGPKNFYKVLWDAYHTVEPFYGTLSLKIDGGFVWDNDYTGPYLVEWYDWQNTFHTENLTPPIRKDIQFSVDKWWPENQEDANGIRLRVSSYYPSQWYVGVSLSKDFHFYIVCTPKT